SRRSKPMSDTPSIPPDDLTEWLRPPSVQPPNDRLREALWRRTRGVLRWRRRGRRLAMVAALAACYLAGLCTMRLGAPSAGDNATAVTRSGPAVDQNRQPEPPPKAVVSALDLEWQAIDSTDRRAELYRRAGDKYLEESNDV